MKFCKAVIVAFLFMICEAITAYAGWEQLPDLRWKYSTEQGYASGWEYIDNHWYYFLDDQTCVQNKFWNVNGKWYYFDEQGVMADKDRRINNVPVSISKDGACHIIPITGYQQRVQRSEETIQSGDALMNSIVASIDRSKSTVEQVNQVAVRLSELFEYPDVIEYPLTVDTYYVLQNRITVCSGYCNVMKIILDRLGIYSEIVEDKTKFHCWMYFQDGNTGYYIDPTWYDTMRGESGFLAREIPDFKVFQNKVCDIAGIEHLDEYQVQFKN